MELEKKQMLEPLYKCVSETGIQEINVYLKEALHRVSFVWFPLSWSWEWLIERGDYRGKLPNRVVSLVKKRYGVKLTSEQKSAIGNIARKHLLAQDMYTIDFTDTFDWDAGDFCDHGSCFWNVNSGARDVMEEEGVIAIRFYNKGGEGFGRAWLYELDDDAWALFNAYGLECTEAASVFATKLGEDTGEVWKYEELDRLLINGMGRGFVYINNSPQIIYRKGYNPEFRVDLDWDVPYGLCEACGDWVHEDNTYYDEENYESYCYDCYEALLVEREEERLAEIEEEEEEEEEEARLEELMSQGLREAYHYTYQQAVLAHSLRQEAIREDIRAQLVAGQMVMPEIWAVYTAIV